MFARPSDRHLVFALIALTLTKGIVWIAILPIWKVADEPAHFDNVQYRAEHRLHKPIWDGRPVDKVMGKGTSPELRKSWKASLKYSQEETPPNAREVPEEEQLEIIGATPDSRRTDGQMPAQEYPGVYYNLGVFPYLLFHHSSVLTRAVAVRVLSLLFGLMAVLATFYAARLVFDSPMIAFAAAAIVALQPMESQQTAAVNNDAGVIGLCALVFYLQMRMVAKMPREATLLEGALLGGFTGLAILTKTQGLAMLPGGLAVLAMAAIHNPRSRNTWLLIGSVLATFLVVRLFPSMWNLVHPDPLPIKMYPITETRRFGPFPSPLSFPSWIRDLPEDYTGYLFRSAWGQFCWLEFALGDVWIEWMHQIWSVCTLGLLAAAAMRAIVPPAQRLWWRFVPMTFAAASAVSGVCFILFCEYYARVRLNLGLVIQGRNFLFALPPVAIVVALALGSLVPARFRTLVSAAIVTGMLALNVASILRIVDVQHGG